MHYLKASSQHNRLMLKTAMAYRSNIHTLTEAMQAVRKTEVFLGLPEGSLLTKSRERRYVDARCVLMYYFTRYLRMTTTAAGAILNRNHATCIHSIKTYHELQETSKEFRTYSEDILRHVGMDRMEGQKKVILEAIEAVEAERSKLLKALESLL